MTKPQVRMDRVLRWTFGGLVLVLMALVMSSWSGTVQRGATHFQWRDFREWSWGWKRVAYCSEQNASLRGWMADLGPLGVSHLRPILRASEPIGREGAAGN